MTHINSSVELAVGVAQLEDKRRRLSGFLVGEVSEHYYGDLSQVLGPVIIDLDSHLRKIKEALNG